MAQGPHGEDLSDTQLSRNRATGRPVLGPQSRKEFGGTLTPTRLHRSLQRVLSSGNHPWPPPRVQGPMGGGHVLTWPLRGGGVIGCPQPVRAREVKGWGYGGGP